MRILRPTFEWGTFDRLKAQNSHFRGYQPSLLLFLGLNLCLHNRILNIRLAEHHKSETTTISSGMKDLFNDKTLHISVGTKNVDRMTSRPAKIVNGAKRLFQHAYSLEKSGLRSQAENYYNKIIEFAENLHRENPSVCSAYVFAQIAHSHGKELFTFGRIEDARKAFARSTDLLTSSVTEGVSLNIIELLAESLHWLARCQRKIGDFEGAKKSYSKSIPLLRNLLLFKLAPEKQAKLHVMFNTAVFGYSKIRRQFPTIHSQIQ